MKVELWHAFVLGAILSWGVYVPVLHRGQVELGEDPKHRPGPGSVRAFLCVGIAYFLTAVLVPLALLYFDLAGGEKLSYLRKDGSFNAEGFSFALMAGVAGAAGALCIILSMKNGGTPLYVPPLVFAGAPIVNVLVSLAWKPPKQMPGALFYVGIVLAAIGAGLVLYSKAQLDSAKPKENGAASTTTSS